VPTDPNSKTSIALDEMRARNALGSLAAYDDRKLSTLKGKDLERIAEAVTDLMGPVFRERDRRKQTPRGKGRLRLVAEGGELTQAGRHLVNGRKGGRATAARRAAVATA
jgi:hypothetical protein